jgi:hypothetical protein
MSHWHPIVVTQAGEGWSAKAQTDDPNCAVRVAQIAGRLSEKFDIEVFDERLKDMYPPARRRTTKIQVSGWVNCPNVVALPPQSVHAGLKIAGRPT